MKNNNTSSAGNAMRRQVATFAPITRWGKDNGKQITMWYRGHSWYIGIKNDAISHTILHAGSEQYIRGVWKRKYVKRTVDTRWQG